VQHGLANAIMLPHVMRFNLPGTMAQFAQIREALGAPSQGSVRERAGVRQSTTRS